jgi:hypothetical protein
MASKRGLDGEYLLADESNGKRAKSGANGDSLHAETDNGENEEGDDAEDEEGDFKDEDDEVDAAEEVDGSNRLKVLISNIQRWHLSTISKTALSIALFSNKLRGGRRG